MAKWRNIVLPQIPERERLMFFTNSTKKFRIKRIIGFVVALSIFVLVFTVYSSQTFAASKHRELDDALKDKAGSTMLAYELQDYELNTKVNKNHSYEVENIITVNLPSDTLSIDMTLPSSNFVLSDVKVKGYKSKVTTVDGEKILSISSGEFLKEGKHVFRITYTIKEFAERTDENDMFYYDALLPDWRVPIANLSIKVEFPADFPWEGMQYYAGRFGVANQSTKLNYNADAKNRVVTISGQRIPENFSVTLKEELPNGYWEGALNSSWAGYAVPLTMLLTLFIGVVLWFIGGRDHKIKKKPQNRPIDGVAPSDITYIYEGKVRIRDVILLIIYMADKGYIRISEYAPKKYRLYRLNDPKEEERYIRTAYNILFEGVYENRSIDMDDLGPRLHRMLESVRPDIEAGYSDESMAPRTGLSKLLQAVDILLVSLSAAMIPVFTSLFRYVDVSIPEALAVAIFTAASLIFVCFCHGRRYDSDDNEYYRGMALSVLLYLCAIGVPSYLFARTSGMWAMGVLTIVAAVALMSLCIIMTARGKGNAELVTQLNQLRNFIFHSKPSEAEELQKEDPNYFYEMLIYALIFSGSEKWTRNFRGKSVPDQVWYSDEIQGHAHKRDDLVGLARDLKGFIRTMETSYNAMMHSRRSKRRV